MNLKKIIIYEYDILFKILDEVKENLNFEILKANQENLEDIKKNLISDFIIISKENSNSFKDHIVIDNKPMKIEKFLEIINIYFLKKKFNIQSDVNLGTYSLNLNSRHISKKEKKLHLTERETNLIIYLKKAKGAVKIDELQKEVWDYGSKLETHTVETHIYRLRKKIKEKFNDDKFIISSKEGYTIN